MKKKQKSKKPVYILIGFFVVFGLFIYALTRPSKQSIAIKKLETCYNQEDVKMLWYENKDDLYKDEVFLTNVRDKLSSFNLENSELKKCQEWLPKPPTNLNIIVVPDLSRRIIDALNNPEQIENDKLILKNIRESFEKITMLKMNSKDKITVTITDTEQAKGRFKNVADELTIDLSSHKNKSNRLYYTDYKKTKFNQAVDSLYEIARLKPVGADYTFFIRRHLGNYLKKSTLYETYNNKVIIITDGYIETENRPPETKVGYNWRYSKYRSQLKKSVLNGSTINVINKYNLNIPSSTIDLSETEILICEVNERKVGIGYDYEILNTYWKDWFINMNVLERDFYFMERNPSSDFTLKQIDEFIQK